MVEAPSPQGESIISVIAAFTMATVQKFEPGDIGRGFQCSGGFSCAGASAGETLRQKRRAPRVNASTANPKTAPNITARVLCGKIPKKFPLGIAVNRLPITINVRQRNNANPAPDASASVSPLCRYNLPIICGQAYSA